MKKKRVLIFLATIVLVLAGVIYANIREREFSKQFFAMDTVMKIKLYDMSRRHANDMLALSVQEIARLENILSTGKEDSEVSKWNQKKNCILSPDCQYLLKKSLVLHKETQGCFDITIYPVMKAWGFTDDSLHIPEQQLIDLLLEEVDASAILYDEQTKRAILPEDCMIDFGGIAKGYTSSCLIELLKKHGIEHALLDLGGNIHVLGTKPDGSSWKVAVRFPDDYPGEKAEYLGILSLIDQAAITSGGYERFFEEGGKRYHHIIDPNTGMPADSGVLSATIVSSDAALADGLSTALYVAGVEKAITIWKNREEDFGFILFTKEGKIYLTEDLQKNFSTEFPCEVIYDRKLEIE